ncbi:MAG TPA: serine protease [Rhizomicrobium sp.]
MPSFKAELEKAGYKVVTPGEDNLFDPEGASADYEAAAVITDEHIEGCFSRGGLLAKGNWGDVRGDSSMKVDWQIYSPIRKQVVAHVSTTGTAHLDQSTAGGQQLLLERSFAQNVAALASNTDFRTAMSASKALTAGLQMPGEQNKIALSGSLKAGPRKIADAAGSIVTIMNSNGSGSGILVSDDGYALTNAHVVGDDKSVRVRWPDGLEGIAQVVRVSKNRDIAIVKTNPRDRAPLALKRGAVTPGLRVYAIGSPNGKEFQGTVSSGVISADRLIEGLRYIQSDVSISPGSSGGALLNENGEVIGVTVSTYLNGGERAGLNMFIPIGDAMDFLALEQH